MVGMMDLVKVQPKVIMKVDLMDEQKASLMDDQMGSQMVLLMEIQMVLIMVGEKASLMETMMVTKKVALTVHEMDTEMGVMIFVPKDCQKHTLMDVKSVTE